jgi:transcriptional antiterminator RfaH
MEVAVFWAVARFHQQREHLAIECLRLNGFEVYVPRVKEKRLLRGRKVSVAVALFQGYGFVRIEQQFHVVRKTPGVIDLVMNLERPAKVPDEEIDKLRARERHGVVVLPPKPPPLPDFAPGDRLRVRVGPFVGFSGIYQGQAPRDRVLVLLAMLGGQRAVELPRDGVRRV